MKKHWYAIVAAWIFIVVFCALFWRPILAVCWSIYWFLLILVTAWIKGVPPHMGGPIPN